MTRSWWLTLGVLALLTVGLLVRPRSSRAATNKIEVKGVEVAHRLDGKGLKVRLTLTSREAVEFSAEEPAEVQVTLQMTQIFSSSRAKMFAEVEGRAVRAIHVAVE